MSHLRLFVQLTAVLLACWVLLSDSAHAQESCSNETIQQLLQPSKSPDEFILNCSATLPRNSHVTRSVVFEGAAASFSELDCNGSTLDAAAGKGTLPRIALHIRSSKISDDLWSAPTNVKIKNCLIKGFVRVYGLAYTGSDPALRDPSLHPDYTAYAQANAPKLTTLSNIKFIAPGNIPLYIGPGVTRTAVKNSQFLGTSIGPAIYLDAESARNSITSNRFNIAAKREVIALDGSAANEIIGNDFANVHNGGIYLYRNCGEGGVIRHQTPSLNDITGNIFHFAPPDSRPAVWFGSRGGRQSYCSKNELYPFGSGADPRDFAQENVFFSNVLVGGTSSFIRDEERRNKIAGNIFEIPSSFAR
ncbi:right-handed parallel beta-helix repeat-containing protein [Sinorhizobium meliloti]|uniref:right-handed parallel beta-helix repeat-containing protein n=1 Tax=Rhizobium meliloti TaxID=382 RepID=UPI000FDA51B5|nr:right-handed parallel beta-helix repeat-containing protein [Sinorhizobium meliloti]RVP97716.1 right-handed parallel beta-helix repeat-containing protein [Sinorhizobium meliloti]